MAERWRDKYPLDLFEQSLSWANVLTDWADTIADGGATAEVIYGTVTVDEPPSSFSGAAQAVWVSGGTPGWQIIRCKIETAGGRTFTEEAGFMVL